MNPNSNLTPELKEIYDRVMKVAQKSPSVTPVPPLNSSAKPFTTPTFPYVGTVPVIKVSPAPAPPNTPPSTSIAPPTNIVTPAPPQITPSPVPANTIVVKSTAPVVHKHSKTNLITALLFVFTIFWTGFWAVLLGFIRI